MIQSSALAAAFAAIPGLQVRENAPLRDHTRFALGGPARFLADAFTERAFVAAAEVAGNSDLPFEVIGGGSNLVVADSGYPGILLRHCARGIIVRGAEVTVESGAVLQDLVDATIAAGLAGLHTMTGIPGWTGGAIYGNAGAYGNTISDCLYSIRFAESGTIFEIPREACEFTYRESIFKRHKERVVLSARLRFTPADPAELARAAAEIRRVRDAKYPPSMMCAGSIFKNCLLAELPRDVAARVPENVVRDGKIPSAWFLEQAGAKGLRRGGAQVAGYHANLIYNDGFARAEDVRWLIAHIKQRVAGRFGFQLEEEVQFLGFPPNAGN